MAATLFARSSSTLTMAGLREAKRRVRQSMKTRLDSLGDEQIAWQSHKVTQKVFSLPEYQKARALGIYLSMPKGELSTKAIVEDAIDQGKTVFVPYLHRIDSSDTANGESKMDMLSIHSREDLHSLKPDRWSIPTLEASSIENRRNAFGGFGLKGRTRDEGGGQLDLVLMPGVAFDQAGRRLGHGKGYYDRFLREYREAQGSSAKRPTMPFLAALALQEQILPPDEQIPVGIDDWAVDTIITADPN